MQKGIHVVSPPNLERTAEVARHQLRDNAAGLLIEFHKPYLINKIRWKVSATLVDPIQSPFPAHDAFTIETSLDGTSWRRVVEREQNNNCLLFWSERSFYFKPQVVQFIHIKGEVRRIHLEREMTYWFQVKHFEATYSTDSYDFTPEGVLLPYFNCAAIPFTETTSKDDYFRANCSMELKYKYPRAHRIRGKYIEFTLVSTSSFFRDLPLRRPPTLISSPTGTAMRDQLHQAAALGRRPEHRVRFCDRSVRRRQGVGHGGRQAV